MLLEIRHGLLEITNHPNTRKSAIIINNEIILSSGSILQSYIQPLGLGEECASSKILHDLQNDLLVNVQGEHHQTDESKLLNSLNYQITFDRKSLVNRSQILTRHCAKLLYVFSCKEVLRYFRHLSAKGAHIGVGVGDNECLLSSFVVLSFAKPKNQKDTFKKFTTHITNYLRFLYSVQNLDDILTICTPFGLESFYKTVNIGKISNVVTPNGSLFVLSNTLPVGCEGAAVFNDKLRLIGMIVCTKLERQSENVHLTLAANFSYLLTDFLRKVGINVTSIAVPKKISNFQWERGLVAITINDQECTGTLVKILNKTLILTCSHAITDDNTFVVACRGIHGHFDADLIWKHPNNNRQFDVAILKPRSNIPNKYFVKLSTATPHAGQIVYNAGFPFIMNSQHIKDDFFNPSILQGRIIKYSPGRIMSDGCVQAGQSGGPMYDENGCVLGICVSNIKWDGVIYPNCNTAVPINDIRHTLEQYARTNDLTVLDDLIANDDLQNVWSLETPPIQSKI